MTLADVIVIGGGIAGISAAAELAAHAKVVVLEGEKQLGYHSTGRSAAVFIRNYGNATLRAINAAAEPVFMTPAGISETSLLSPRGVMFVADKDELPKLDAFAQGSSGLERLTAAEAVEFVPILRGDRIAAAMLEPAAQNIDVDRMLQGYVRLLKSRGGQALTGAGVTGLHRQGGVWQIRTSLGDFRAPVVVNASGAWADEIAKLAGVAPVGLTPLRRSAR